MAVTIKLKNSVTQDAVPTTTHLPAVGELALNANINSLGIYMRASDNSIVKMAGPGSVTTVAASTTVAGISEYATNAETTTGTSTTRSVTPAGLKAVTDAERTTSNSTYLALAGGTLTGVLAATAGSNSAPSIHFGDSDSGIFGGTNTVSLAAGGTTRLTADTGVSVVGTLAVTGAITSTSDITLADKLIHSGDTNTAIRFPAADTFSVETGGAEALRVDSSQRLLVASSTSRTIWGANPKVQIESTDSNTALTLIRNEANNAGPWIALAKSRGGSNGSHTIVQDGDSLGSINWFGADGVDLAGTSGEIRVEVDGTPGSNDLPGRLVFKTTADGANAPTTRLTISSAGHLTATKNIKTGDDAELILGEGNDLRLWHNGTDSYIKNYTGDLYIQGDGDDLHMRAADDVNIYTQTSDKAIVCVGDGGVELYFDNSKKFESKTNGVEIHGHLISGDSNEIQIGNSGDLKIYHNGTNNYIDGNKNNIYIRNNVDGDDGGNIYIEAKSGETSIECADDGFVSLYYDGSKKLETTSDGVTIGGDSGVTGNWQLETYNGSGSCGNVFAGTTGAYLYIQDTGSSEKIGILANGRASITSYKVDDPLVLSTTDSNGTSDRLIIEGDGDIRIPQDNKKLSFGAGDDLKIYHSSGSSIIADNSAQLYIRANAAIKFQNDAVSETFAKFHENGDCELYYDNSQKLATYSGGCIVTGQLSADAVSLGDGEKILLGSGDDIEFYHDSADSHLVNKTGVLYIKNNAKFSIVAKQNAEVALYHNDSKKFNTSSTGAEFHGEVVKQTGTGETYHAIGSTNAGGAAIYLDGDSDGDFAGSDYSWIRHRSDGDFEICCDDPLNTSSFYLKVKDGTASAIDAITAAGVKLYYDGNLRFETLSTGAKVSGRLDVDGDLISHTANNNSLGLTAHRWNDLFIANDIDINDDGKILLGTGDDLQIFHQASNNVSYIQQTISAQHLIIKNTNTDATGSIWIEPRSGETAAKFDGTTGEVSLRHGGNERFTTTSTGATVHGNLKLTGGTGTDLEIHTDNAAGIVYKADENGHKFQSWTGSSWETAAHFQDNLRVKMPEVYSTSGSSMRDVQIESNGTLCGQSSIRAAKTNIAEITDVSWIYDLKPVSFNFRKKTVNDDGTNTYLDEAETEKAHGLIAEEVEAVNQDFCFYDKDKDGKDVLAGVYYKALISPLIKVVQEQKKEIDILKTQVAALGG